MNDNIAACDSPRARVIRTVRGWIQDGKLRPGDVIPTEQALCERLEMSRGTVRAALSELTALGFLVARKGCRRIVAMPSQPVSATMRKTIVLVSGLEESISDWQETPGRLHAIEGSALRTIQQEGYHGLAVKPDTLGHEELANLCRDRPVGVIIPDPYAVLPAAIGVAQMFSTNGVPVVFNADGGPVEAFDRVISDQSLGAMKIAQALIARGCKRILRLWAREADLYWIRDRNAGFEKAMKEAGIAPIPYVRIFGLQHIKHPTRETFESQTRLFAGYLIEHLANGAERPDALMVTSDAEVPAAAAACRLLGVVPNRDILIAGFDNMWKRMPDRQFEPSPPVFTADKTNVRIGEALVKLLVARVDGDLPKAPQRVLVAPELITNE